MVLRGPAAILLLLLSGLPSGAGAQEWRAGAQFGRVDYVGATADAARASTFSLSASRLGVNDWLGASVSLPVTDEPLWGVLGAWKRWTLPRQPHFALDATVHGFLQRQRDRPQLSLPGTEEPERSGQGAGGELALVGRVSRGRARGEARAGAVAQASSVSDVASSSLIPFGDVRVLHDFGAIQAGPDLRLWFGDSAVSYAGARAFTAAGPIEGWATLGRWLGASQDAGFAWSLGASLPLGGLFRIDADYRSGSFDPLYRAGTGSALTIGASVRLGGRSGVAAPVPAEYENGRATIRVPADQVRGRPSVAGDFNGWKPQPMVPAGDDWTFSVRLEPGVYNYAFVNDSGEWFVPESTPGRRPDGMGGWQAVLVIS